MDDVGGRWHGPTTRLARGGNQQCNVGAEVATKIHEHYRAIEGCAGHENPADRIEDYAE
jgi:hypothetical protein